MLRSILICLSAILMSSTAWSQESFVQFIADGLNSQEEVMGLMTQLNAREGVTSSRAEFFSDNVVIFLEGNVTYSRDEIAAWTEFEHLNVLCFRKGVVGADQVLRLRKEDCDTQMIDNED